MRKTTPLATLLLALPLVAACGGRGPSWTQPPSSGEPRMDVTVHFTDAALQPATAHVFTGGSVAWTNFSSSRTGSVFFSDEVRASFTCLEMPPTFMKTGRGFESIPIHQNVENVTLPCPLDPGEYPYQVWLYDAPGAGLGVPVARMSGTIVVVDPPPEEDEPAGEP